ESGLEGHLLFVAGAVVPGYEALLALVARLGDFRCGGVDDPGEWDFGGLNRIVDVVGESRARLGFGWEDARGAGRIGGFDAKAHERILGLRGNGCDVMSVGDF